MGLFVFESGHKKTGKTILLYYKKNNMLNSCKYCSRIHEASYKCPPKAAAKKAAALDWSLSDREKEIVKSLG